MQTQLFCVCAAVCVSQNEEEKERERAQRSQHCNRLDNRLCESKRDGRLQSVGGGAGRFANQTPGGEREREKEGW